MSGTTKLISRSEVIALLEIDEEFLVSLEREQIVACQPEGGYTATSVEQIRVCHSLHAELGVNLAGLEVALQLLETIQAERDQFQAVLDWLHEQLSGRPG